MYNQIFAAVLPFVCHQNVHILHLLNTVKREIFADENFRILKVSVK